MPESGLGVAFRELKLKSFRECRRAYLKRVAGRTGNQYYHFQVVSYDEKRNPAVGRFSVGRSDSLAEPCAVAPDARVNFSVMLQNRALPRSVLHGLRLLFIKLTHYQKPARD
jgi:hypothetical protein